MKIGVIGAGAVGGYYGAKLSSNGFEVHFLLHSDFEHVCRHGLWVESKDGDINLTSVNAYNDAGRMPLCDMVIVALKATQNHILKDILPKAVKQDGIVVLLQNGLGGEEDIAAICPDATVIGGLCFLCSNKVGPGHIRHLDYGSIRMGEYRPDNKPAGITKALEHAAEIFGRAAIPIHLTDNLPMARWEKLVWNIPFNGLSVILDADTRQMIDSESSRHLIAAIMDEVIEGAKHCGIRIKPEFSDLMLKATRQMVAYKPSMKLDFEANRPLEIDMIYHRPIQAARHAGFDMCMSRVIAAQLEFLDAKNRNSDRSPG